MKRLEKGFTLIELMVVIAIIAILAGVAAPKFGVQMKKAHDAKGLAVIGALRSAAQMYVADNSDTAAAAIPTYGALRLAIDVKSQDLVVAGIDGARASVKVGTNNVNYATIEGLERGKGTTVILDKPTDEGLILINNKNGNDAKGTTWSA